MALTSAQKSALRRVALDDATTGNRLQAKVRSVARLVEAGAESPLSRKRLALELRRVTRTPSPSGRAAEAVTTAIDLLTILEAPAPSEEGRSRHPRKKLTAPWGYWPWPTEEDFVKALDKNPFLVLDSGLFRRTGEDGQAVLRCHTHADRDRWREQVEGPPPWTASRG